MALEIRHTLSTTWWSGAKMETSQTWLSTTSQQSLGESWRATSFVETKRGDIGVEWIGVVERGGSELISVLSKYVALEVTLNNK